MAIWVCTLRTPLLSCTSRHCCSHRSNLNWLLCSLEYLTCMRTATSHMHASPASWRRCRTVGKEANRQHVTEYILKHVVKCAVECVVKCATKRVAKCAVKRACRDKRFVPCTMFLPKHSLTCLAPSLFAFPKKDSVLLLTLTNIDIQNYLSVRYSCISSRCRGTGTRTRTCAPSLRCHCEHRMVGSKCNDICSRAPGTQQNNVDLLK
jgi:hypothetical protein